MTTTPRDVVLDFYNKLAAGDAPGALGLMAPDIEWVTMWHYKIEGRGPGPVAEGLFKPLMAEWTSFSLVPTEFIAEGETIVSLGDFQRSPRCHRQNLGGALRPCLDSEGWEDRPLSAVHRHPGGRGSTASLICRRQRHCVDVAADTFSKTCLRTTP